MMIDLIIRICWIIAITLFLLPPILFMGGLLLLVAGMLSLYDKNFAEVGEIFDSLCELVISLYRFNPVEEL